MPNQELNTNAHYSFGSGDRYKLEVKVDKAGSGDPVSLPIQLAVDWSNIEGAPDIPTIPSITVSDTTSASTHPFIGDITASDHTITVTRKSLADVGLSTVYRYKGTKTWSQLLAITSAAIGDVYNISDEDPNGATGMDWACYKAVSAATTASTYGSYWQSIGGTVDLTGYVEGPASATDNAIARYNGTTGKVIQNSSVTIDDNGTLTATTIKKTNGADTHVLLAGGGTKAISDFAIDIGDDYLPLAGGEMSGPITYSTEAGPNKSSNYISAGGGYSTGSGKYGIKLLCCDQPDCQSGLGQDLTDLSGGYEFSIAGGRSTGGVGYISFAMHDVDSTTYSRLGYFDNGGNLYVTGNLTLDGNNIKINGAMTQVTNPAVIPVFINGDSKYGLGWTNVSNLTVGSAGNADTLDSYHASDFLLLSGGTMSGSITLPHGTSIKNNSSNPILEYRGSDSDGSGTRVGDYNDRMVLLTSGDDLWHYNHAAGGDGKILDSLNYSAYTTPYKSWHSTIHCSTWSRLCYVARGISIIGSKFILNIGGTRGNVVYNDTFIITAHHLRNGKIVKIAGHNYSAGYQVRLVSNSNGDCYFEIYDNCVGATSSTLQDVYCRLISIFNGEVTPYEQFTSGETIPSDYSIVQTLTITNDDMQGNLGGNASTASYANKVQVNDIRNTSGLPSQYYDKMLTAFFNNQDLPSGVHDWKSGIHVKGWSNDYNSWELASDSSSWGDYSEPLSFRVGRNNTWGDWRTIIDSGNIGSQSVNHADNAHRINCLANLDNTDVYPTVGAVKNAIISVLGSSLDIGSYVIISESVVSQWNHDDAAPYPSSSYAVISIGGAYDGNRYGQYLLSGYNNNRVGYIGRSGGAWTGIKWIANTEDLSAYLPLSGGTVSGPITLTGGTITWDSAGLPACDGHRVPASNLALGRNGIILSGGDTYYDGAAIWMENGGTETNKLIIGLGDDATQGGTNDYIAFRYYDTAGNATYESKVPFKSGTLALTSDIPTKTSQLTNDSGYITSSGSCNYASSAGNADTLDGYHASNLYTSTRDWQDKVGLQHMIDLSDTSVYDVNTYYPVLDSGIPYDGQHLLEVACQLNTNVPSWSTHQAGFTANLKILMKAGGWGTTNGSAICLDHSSKFCDKNPVGYTQLTTASRNVLYLRGGGQYRVFTDYQTSWTPYTSEYSYGNQSVYPRSDAGVDINRVTVGANIDGSAGYASKLQTYKADGSGTYGTQYPLYAQWEANSILKLKCDNYTVKTDYADSAGSATKATQDGNGNVITDTYVNKNTLYPVSPRDFINGTLITTDINYANAQGAAFYLEIVADTYGGLKPMFTQAQGYIYYNTIINYGMINHGHKINELYAMNVNGALCFWFPRLSYWQSFGCKVCTSSNGDYNTNHVVSVTDSAKPNGTKVVNLHDIQYNVMCFGDTASNANTAGYADSAGYASSAGSVAWDNVSGKPSIFPPAGHDHTYLAFSEATVANTRTQPYTQALLVGGWASNEAGYGYQYGTSLDISGYSTWYHRLAFHTNGNIDYWQGINTNTLTKIGRLITSANIDAYALPLSGGTITGTLGHNANYLIKPVADYRTTSGRHTGAITIALPAGIGNTMVSMWIDVYNYVTETSFSVHVGGYTYANQTWYNNPFAMVYGADHTVRLGHNGTNFVIYIGETSSTWEYPQISVRDVILGYAPSYSNWWNNWSVSFSTSFSNVTHTSTNAAITTKNIGSQSVNYANSAGYASSAGNADTLDGYHASNFLSRSGGSMSGPIDLSNMVNSRSAIKFRSDGTWDSGIGYDTQGNESLFLWAKNRNTRLRWNAGTDFTTFQSGSMMNITPDFEISKASGTATGYIGGNTIVHSGNLSSQPVIYALQRDVDALKNAVCLREGTQILMADGSSKNIEDIKKGDMVMSYDPQTETFFPSEAFGEVYTGRDTTWTVFYFDNGAHLDIATNHPIYSPLVGIPYYSWLWKIGYEAISSEGSIIHYAYSRKVVKTTIPYKRYQLYCDSGLYFANGVLCGHLAADPVKIYYRTDGHAIDLTDEEVAFYTELAKEVDDSPNAKYSNEEYLREVMPIELQKSIAMEKVEDYKKELADRDYKTIKAFQGLVTEEENAQNIAECEEYRAKIAVEEETIKNCDSQIAAIDEKYDATCEDKYDIWRRQLRTVVEMSKERHKDWSSESSCSGCSDEGGDN